MVDHRPLGRLAVPPLQGREHVRVGGELTAGLVGIEPLGRPGGHREAVAYRPGLPAEERRAADVGDPQVEVPALAGQPVVAAGVGVAGHRGVQVAQPGQLLGGDPGRRQPRPEALDDRAQPVELLQCVVAQVDHRRAVVRLVADQAVPLQPAQRLPYRGDRDAEPPRDRAGAQGGPAGDAGGADLLQQHAVDVVGLAHGRPVVGGHGVSLPKLTQALFLITYMNMTSLAGLRVIDAATLFAGPTAAMMLGDFGADVIKIEHPRRGDPARGHGASADGVGLWWKTLARNKRAAAVDLSRAEGQEILRRLAGRSDVLVENFRPGTLERWGIGPDVLLERNPRLIVARMTGFGQFGPMAARPGFGTLAEAM